MKAGDVVWYVPSEIYAFQAGPDGELPLALGKSMPPDTAHESAWVQPLDDRATKLLVSDMRKVPNARAERSKLVVTGTRTLWPAYIHSVNDDGTVNLDVAGGGGATLHCPRVKVDPGKSLHSCHPAGMPDIKTQYFLSRIERRGEHVVP
jgi:hypothetical protein